MLLKKKKAEFLNANLAGFGHSEGFAVLNEMRAADRLLMIREDENKHDNDAIALFYVPKNALPEGVQTHVIAFDGKKYSVTEDVWDVDLAAKGKKKSQDRTFEALHVGYIPANCNKQLAMFLDHGHSDIFECVITHIDKDVHPNQQVQIRVNLLDK